MVLKPHILEISVGSKLGHKQLCEPEKSPNLSSPQCYPNNEELRPARRQARLPHSRSLSFMKSI